MNLKYAFGLIALSIAVATPYFAVGHLLSRPAHQRVGEPPHSLAANSVELRTASGEKVSGWIADGHPGGGAVLLLHGVRSSRLQMLGRAEFLSAAGYAVLLIDLPSHGESEGSRITFGANEALAVTTALNFLHGKFPHEELGVIGVSLGAASTVLASRPPVLRAVVLESMYPTIEDAVRDRLQIRLGAAGRWLAPILLWQLPLYAGVGADALQPENLIARIGAPVLIASGDLDRHTRWAETERLFAAAVRPKELWRVRGAAHVDLYDYAPAEYQQRILDFLKRTLRASPESFDQAIHFLKNRTKPERFS